MYDLLGFDRTPRTLTSSLDLELRAVGPRQLADTDTDLVLKCHRVSKRPELVQFVPHLLQCLNHGAAMFPQRQNDGTEAETRRRWSPGAPSGPMRLEFHNSSRK